MSDINTLRLRKIQLVPSSYAKVEDENVKTEEMPTKTSKTTKSNEESSDYFKLEPVEKPVTARFNIEVEEFERDLIILDEANKQINEKHIEQNISENELENIIMKQEDILENEINEALKKAFFKRKAQIENKLQETIHNMISEDSDEDIIDESDSSLYFLVNVNDTKNRNRIEIPDEQQTDDAKYTKAIDIQEKELADKNLLDSGDNKPTNKGMLTFNSQILCSEKILNEVDIISKTSTNLVDKILAIEIRNCFGRSKFVALEESKQETMLQEAFQCWKEWQRGKKARGVPLCYKCYVCKIAFWHLHPFREHIRTHESIEIKMEVQTSECSVKAFETEMEFQTFHIDSNCWRCGNDFESHPTLMYPNAKYKCSWCKKLFFTCTALNIHKNICDQFMREHINKTTNPKPLQCTLCPLLVWQEDEFTNHLKLSHSVRSDLPIAAPTVKLCNNCNQKCVYPVSHICNRKYSMHSCLHCNRPFPTLEMLNMHIQYSSTEYICPICSITLPKQCMMAKHLTTHSENFQTIYRSVVCNRICLNENTVKVHNWKQHKKRSNKNYNLYDTVIILKKTMGCITPLEVNPELTCSADCEDYIIEKNNFNTDTTHTAKKTNIIEEHKPNIETVTSLNTLDNEDASIDVINKYNDVFIKKEMDLVYNDENDSINDELNIKTEPGEYDEDNEESALSDLRQSADVDTGIMNDEIDKLYEDYITVLSNDLYVNKIDVNNVGERIHRRHIIIVNCTKCSQDNRKYQSLRKYLLHLRHVHNLDKLKCPECGINFSKFSLLSKHLKKHVKRLYARAKIIKYFDENDSNSHYMCKKCRMRVDEVDVFAHWETHLVLPDEEKEDSYDVTIQDDEKDKIDDDLIERAHGELDAVTLKKLIKVLTTDTTTSRISKANRKKIRACPQCKRQFDRLSTSKRHIIEHLLADAYAAAVVTTVGALTCQICSETYKNIYHYKKHMRDHGGLTVYSCELCKKAFSDASNFVKHKKTHNLGVIICDICGKKYQAKLSLIKHLKTHNEEKPVCAVCMESFHSESLLKKHIKFKHEKIRSRFFCRECVHQPFDSYGEKSLHMWLCHKRRKRKADCPICKKQFRILQDVKKHLLEVHRKRVTYSDIGS